MEKFYTVISSLSIGDRIMVPKSAFEIVQHHALYLGFSDDHHWIIENKEGYGVRVVSAKVFFKDVLKITKIVPFVPSFRYSRKNLLAFALSKVGTPYSLTSYNCESFCNEVQYGVAKSKQVETAVGVGVLALSLAFIVAAVSSSD